MYLPANTHSPTPPTPYTRACVRACVRARPRARARAPSLSVEEVGEKYVTGGAVGGRDIKGWEEAWLMPCETRAVR